MTTTPKAPPKPATSLSVWHLTVLSAIAIVFSAYQAYNIVTDLLSRLAHRSTTGVSYIWDPGFPAPQPTGWTFEGSPYVVPGSTASFTRMEGTVKELPVGAILLPGLGDLVSVLTTLGIAMCLLILARRVAAGVPFARASARSLVVLAVIVFVGYEAASVLLAVGDEWGHSIAFAKPDFPEGPYSSSTQGRSLIAYWPIYVAVALLSLSAVFRSGAQLQADSDGLI